MNNNKVKFYPKVLKGLIIAWNNHRISCRDGCNNRGSVHKDLLDQSTGYNQKVVESVDGKVNHALQNNDDVVCYHGTFIKIWLCK